MTVYNFNLGIGWASSGVEYAQIYRAQVFRKLGVQAKFIFTDLILSENIQHLTENIGFKNDEIIWLYQYFTDIKIAPTTYTINDVDAAFGMPLVKREDRGKIVRLIYGNQQFITCYLKEVGSEYVQRAEFVSRGSLIRKDYYSYTRVFSEFYAPFDGKAHVYLRVFYNEDGSTAYEEVIDGETHMYYFSDRVYYTKEEFIEYFVECLALDSKDLLIIDRATGLGQAILEAHGDSKLAVIIHADHFSENSSNETYILWNNYYEYQFSHAELFDVFIASTDAQSRLLSDQFDKYTKKDAKIVTIPVGSLDALNRPVSARKPYSIITASRLASEKHIDWLVRAVAEAKKELPELTFDIYGNGGEEADLKKLIASLDAQEYIHLRGHQKLDVIYPQYELYIAGSTSEGFGLSLLEAIGAGLPLIGLDVRYGNQTFIKDSLNGYLLDETLIHGDNKELIKGFADAIIRAFKGDIQLMQEHSYEVAAEFLTEKVEKQWENLLEEVCND